MDGRGQSLAVCEEKWLEACRIGRKQLPFDMIRTGGDEPKMSKYLIEATYTAEGLRGVMKDKAAGRKAAVEKLLAEAGGKLHAIYFGFGDTHVFMVAEMASAADAAALSFVVTSSGAVNSKVTPLFTVEEIDAALGKSIHYSRPGS